MLVKITLKSDAIFGNGQSIPGAEDISVLTDEYGFVYYKGSSLKGLFREAMENLLLWKGKSKQDSRYELIRLLGVSDNNGQDYDKLTFSDFHISKEIRDAILNEYDEKILFNKQEVIDSQTYLRTLTSVDEDGIAKKGSLRMIRCIRQGMVFYGEITCKEEDKEFVLEVLQSIKYIGSLRNRGFGRVNIEEV